MVRQKGMGYGIWESLVHLAGNRLGGHEKVWVTGGYGLLQVWVKTEATVLSVVFCWLVIGLTQIGLLVQIQMSVVAVYSHLEF